MLIWKGLFSTGSRLSGRGDGSNQGRGVDLIGHSGLPQIDDCEEPELRVVEEPQTCTLAAARANSTTWTIAINPMNSTSVVLFTPGVATLTCSAIAIIAAATNRTSTHASWYLPAL